MDKMMVVGVELDWVGAFGRLHYVLCGFEGNGGV